MSIENDITWCEKKVAHRIAQRDLPFLSSEEFHTLMKIVNKFRYLRDKLNKRKK